MLFLCTKFMDFKMQMQRNNANVCLLKNNNMKTVYHKIILLLFSLAFLFVSCKKSAENIDCVSYTNGPVTTIEGPSTALVGQEIVLNVSFQSINGCGQFGSFEETSVGNNVNITVKAKYEGCVCTQDYPIRTTSYKFKKSQSGSYQLRFLQAENTYLTHTVVVQ